MSELRNGMIGAIAGGIAGFIASRFNSYFDNKGKIVIEPFNEKLEYVGQDRDGFPEIHEYFNDQVKAIELSFTLEIRNTAKIRKHYKNAKVILKSRKLKDDAFLVNEDTYEFKGFQYSMMEPLEYKNKRLKTAFPIKQVEHLRGKRVDAYMTIANSKNRITKACICTIENFME